MVTPNNQPSPVVTARAALAAALAIVLVATLTPEYDTVVPPRPWCILCGGRDLADFIMNVALFAPLGASLAYARVTRTRAVWLSAVLSLAIELLQLGIPGRDPNIRDLLANTLGAAVGHFIHGIVVHEIRRSAARDVGSSLPAMAWTVVVLWGSAAVLVPSYPVDLYYGQWVPPRANWVPFPGRVVRVVIGHDSIPDGPIPQSDHVRRLLQDGAPLEVTSVAGPPPAGRAPVFAIVDDHEREVLLIGIDERALILRFRTRSADLRLDQPGFRLDRMLRPSRPTDTLAFRLWRPGAGWCVSAGASQACDVQHTIGSGWRAIYAGNAFGPVAHGVGSFLWLVVVVLPIAFANRTPAAWGVGGVVLVASLVLAPTLVGIKTTPLAEWCAVTAGMASGALSYRACRRLARSG